VSTGVQDTEELRESIRISVTRLVEELVLQKATEVEEILSQRSIVAAKEVCTLSLRLPSPHDTVTTCLCQSHNLVGALRYTFVTPCQ
jgi:hypothetical protein